MKTKFATTTLAASLLALSLGLAGCLTDSKDDDDKGPAPELVTTKTVTAGAEQNADFGSAIDLDSFVSYKITPAKAIAAQIDLIFAYSGAASSAAIYSPDSAKGGIGGSAGFNFLSDFTPANATQIKTVTGVTISSITTKAQVDSLWAAGDVAANGRVLLQAGTTFLAKSNLDLVVLVKVDSVTTGATGKASFSGVAKF